MKVTIDVPAPSELLEQNARLRQKNRNYRTQLRQLTRAHIITLRELERYQERERQNVRVEIDRASIEEVLTRSYAKPYPMPEMGKQDADISFDHPI